MRVLASVGVVVFLLTGLAVAAEEAVFPSQYLQEQEYFSGHWIGEGNVGDDAARVDFSARWAPGKHCLVIHGTNTKGSQKPVRWTILSGCDMDTGEMVDCYFAADGASCVTRWKSVSASEQLGNETGVYEGKPYKVQCKAIKHGPDAWTFSTTTPDGKPVKIEYKRVKEATK